MYLVHEMSTERKKKKKKKKEGRASSSGSSHSLQPLSPWRQHKDILFCFASFPILSKGMKVGGGRGKKSKAQEHKRGEQDFGMLTEAPE